MFIFVICFFLIEKFSNEEVNEIILKCTVKFRQAYKSFSMNSSLLPSVSVALLSGLMGAVGWFSVLFSGWLLAALGPVGLSESCGVFLPRIRRVDGLLDG